MEEMKQHARDLFGLNLTPHQTHLLQLYERELLEWNEKFNLTAIRQVEGIRTKHFLDSLSCHLVLRSRPPKRLADIGCGAGFPGIPLKIIYPEMRLTLVESVGKKARFCQHVVDILKLKGVEVLQTRAEDMGQLKEYREQFDWAVARAVAKLPTLVEYLLPLVQVGGSVLAQKGENGPAEAHSADNATRLLGGHLRQVQHLTLPTITEDRYLITIDKIAATPPKYPRRSGIPAKTPL